MQLDVLDTNSWKEVVEERFIGRICGFPTCDKEIIVKTAQKYKLDKNRQKVRDLINLKNGNMKFKL